MIIKVHVLRGKKGIEIKGNIYFVHTEEPFENNKANIDVMKQLSKFFSKNISQIKLLRGSRSKIKIFEII